MNRKKLSELGNYYICEVHNWDFEPEDYCPECKGEERATERIIKLLKEYWTESNRTWIPIHEAIALIKGEQK